MEGLGKGAEGVTNGEKGSARLQKRRPMAQAVVPRAAARAVRTETIRLISHRQKSRFDSVHMGEMGRLKEL